MAYIYKIVCKENGFIYVGYTKNIVKRYQSHLCELRSGKHSIKSLQYDFSKYGEDAFSCSELERDVDENFKHERENFWILNLGSLKFYNRTLAGESPAYISKKNTGKWTREGKQNSEESKEKTRLALLGRKHTKLRRKHQSEAQKKLYQSGYVNPMKGKEGKPNNGSFAKGKDAPNKGRVKVIIDGKVRYIFPESS